MLDDDRILLIGSQNPRRGKDPSTDPKSLVFLEQAEQVMLIEHGAVVAVGPVAELRRAGVEIARVVSSSTRILG